MSLMYDSFGKGTFPGSRDAGAFPSAREYDRMADAVTALLRGTNVAYFKDSRGVYVRRMSIVPELRRAFVKNTPGATTSVDVYLGKDATGTEVTVECYIYGGGNLEDAFPTLVDGMPLYVQFDQETGVWKNVTDIYKIGLNCSG